MPKVIDDPEAHLVEWERLDGNLHKALESGCNSPLLLRFCEIAYANSERYRRHFASYPTLIPGVEREHRVIMEAALKRDAPAASTSSATSTRSAPGSAASRPTATRRAERRPAATGRPPRPALTQQPKPRKRRPPVFPSPVRRALATVALVAATAAALPASTETIRLRIASGHDENWHFVQLVRDDFIPEVTRRVREETGADVSFVAAWSGTLLKATEVLAGTQGGVADSGLFCVCHEGDKLAAENFPFYLPFGPSDPAVAAARAVYNEFPALENQFVTDHGQRLLALIPFDNDDVIANVRFEGPDDLAGRKTRGAGPNLPWVERIGASPVSVNGPEIYTSFQTALFGGSSPSCRSWIR